MLTGLNVISRNNKTYFRLKHTIQRKIDVLVSETHNAPNNVPGSHCVKMALRMSLFDKYCSCSSAGFLFKGAKLVSVVTPLYRSFCYFFPLLPVVGFLLSTFLPLPFLDLSPHTRPILAVVFLSLRTFVPS